MPHYHPGDFGQTTNFSGKKSAKDSKTINAIGNIDELVAYLGLISYIDPPTDDFIKKIQQQLISTAAEISGCSDTITYCTTAELETQISILKEHSPTLTSFYLPGDKEKPIFINIARTVCRRTERSVVNIKPAPKKAVQFLNRLSSYLFQLQIFAHYH